MDRFLTIALFISLQRCLGVAHTSQGIMGNTTQEYEAVVSGLLSKTEHRLSRPNSGGEPTRVRVGLYLMFLGNFQEANMEFTIEMYFREYWHDPRLAFGSPNRSATFMGETTDNFWHPYTFFENGRRGEIHKITGINKFMRIFPDGRIFSSVRLTLSCSCPMDFRNFPMDRQICDLHFMSYGYTAEDVVYDWNDEGVEWTGEHEVAQFHIEKIDRLKNVKTYAKGEYHELGVRFYFTRRIGYYIIRVYIPAALIVFLSWLSFFVDRNSAPARVSLGITTILTMTTLLIGIGQGSLPVVSYVKAVDGYLIVCFILVFSAFAEFALLSHKNYTKLPGGIHKRREHAVKPETKSSIMWFQDDSWLCSTESRDTVCAKQPKIRAMDDWSKIIFLVIFILFNIVYWCYFLIFTD